MTYNNLFLTDLQGNKRVARDGLWLSFVNPLTGVGYLQPSAQNSYVLDIGTLSPVGMMDSICIFAQDGADGRLYATDAARQALVVLESTGGPSKLPPAQPDSVEGKQVTQIVISPDFAADATLYLVAWTLDETGGQAILRSTDGGQSFTRLGGLPNGDELALTMAISPDFAADGTLFAGGARRELMGEGVWKSTDGGDTWVPVWDGLEHLRVNRIAVSPEYSKDATVLAWAPYTRLEPFENGFSMQRSTDGGLTWTRVITAETLEQLPDATAYLPAAAEALPVRKQSWYQPIEFRVDSSSWTTATGDLGADEILRAILPAPTDAAQAAVYVATEAAVYRTLDEGKSWSALSKDAVGESALMAAAVTPLLNDGTYRLLLATATGALLQLDPNTVEWRALGEEQGGGTVQPTPTIGDVDLEQPPAAPTPATPTAPAATLATPTPPTAPAAPRGHAGHAGRRRSRHACG